MAKQIVSTKFARPLAHAELDLVACSGSIFYLINVGSGGIDFLTEVPRTCLAPSSHTPHTLLDPCRWIPDADFLLIFIYFHGFSLFLKSSPTEVHFSCLGLAVCTERLDGVNSPGLVPRAC